MPDHMFICSHCGQTFVSSWSKEEAEAEARATFTPEELEKTITICDPCWLLLRVMDPVLDHRYKESFNATT